jgi:hypothetical protein
VRDSQLKIHYWFRNFQNHLNYSLRSRINISLNADPSDAMSEYTLQLQKELHEFLNLFSWIEFQEQFDEVHQPNVVDIGARDFSFASVIDRHFRTKGFDPNVHGVEIDSYRRYRNLRSRADYGRFHAKSIPHGYFHAVDFLKWHRPIHFAFLLHPFVTPEPPLRWGLPLSTFRPQQIFDHAFELLAPQGGMMLLSNPSLEEFELSAKFARKSGFLFGESHEWKPSSGTAHEMPRIGIMLKTF